jgi:hypothetical protein
MRIAPAVSGGNLVLSWPGVRGKSYQVQYKYSLDDSVWLNLGNAVVANPAGSLAISAGQAAGYYRVIAIE